MKLDLEEYKKIHSPGYVIGIYNNGNYEEIVDGNREITPSIRECNENTLYDIASLTKTYTTTLIYIAYEEEKLDLEATVKDVDNRFINLDNVRIKDLVCHNQDVWTDGYLGDAKTKKEFYDILFTAYVKSTFSTYVDVHYMILSTILEKLYNRPYAEILKEKIIDKLDLKSTTVYPSGENIASNNYEMLNGKRVENITPGTIHDTKARVAKGLGIITGHASIFTTASDLVRFLKSFLDCSLLKQKTIDLMLEHDPINERNYEILNQFVPKDEVNTMLEACAKQNIYPQLMKTYNYMGTRYKNDIDTLNDVPRICSDRSVAFSGYTGPMYVIDFDNKTIVFIMCNIMHNTTIDREKRKKLTEEIMNMIFDQLYQ